jgi:hypothetical protein
MCKRRCRYGVSSRQSNVAHRLGSVSPTPRLPALALFEAVEKFGGEPIEHIASRRRASAMRFDRNGWYSSLIESLSNELGEVATPSLWLPGLDQLPERDGRTSRPVVSADPVDIDAEWNLRRDVIPSLLLYSHQLVISWDAWGQSPTSLFFALNLRRLIETMAAFAPLIREGIVSIAGADPNLTSFPKTGRCHRAGG